MKRQAGKRKPDTSQIPDSTTSGNEVERRERMGTGRPMMVEGQKYVRHPDDDATFLVSSTRVNLQYTLNVSMFPETKSNYYHTDVIFAVANPRIRFGAREKMESRTSYTKASRARQRVAK